MPSRRSLLAGAASLAATATAGCLDAGPASVSPGTDADTDWPMPDFDADARAYAPNAVAPRESPSERFAVETPSPTDRPVVAGDTVYLPTMGGLLALNAKNGEERWRYDPGEGQGAHFFRSPAVHDGAVYLTGEDPGFVALDAGNGEVRWSVETDTPMYAPPAPTRDWEAFYVGDGEGTVYRVTPDGEVDWTFSVYGAVTRLVADLTTVAVGTEGGEVYTIYDGQGLWRRKVPGKVTALAGDDGSDLFVATFGGGVLRLASGAHAGRARWHAKRGPVAHRSMVVAGGGVFGADGAGLARLDAREGRRAWKLGDDYFSAPAAAGDTVYVAGGGEVAAFKLGGGAGFGGTRLSPRRWTYDLGKRGGRNVAVADGALFVPVEGGQEGTTELLALE